MKKPTKKQRKNQSGLPSDFGLTPAQIAANEQMRRALEEDQYSANGSIVETDDEDEEYKYMYRGQPVRLDRNSMLQATRKHLWMERTGGVGAMPKFTSKEVSDGDGGSATAGSDDDEDETSSQKGKDNSKAADKKGKRAKETSSSSGGAKSDSDATSSRDTSGPDREEFEHDGGSIFGQTAGSSNATWVECDKCKKWRRLRGVVDEKKLPTKWYCSMNKNDPERSRCSAPEEEYESSHTPESATDARVRKHLRVWVRRLQCNEAYEARQPTLTRGKKRAAASSSKDPYEWVRCCNPSCGKWRNVLRIMDAKTHVIDRTNDREWYCVMNTWDEKTASCAAPQENLPAFGCPPWVMQDNN